MSSLCLMAQAAPLGSTVQISPLSVLNAGKQLALSDAIAPQLVGHDAPAAHLQTLQQPLEEAHRGVSIAPRLNEDVVHNAILIDGAPGIVLYALDPDEDFMHVPLILWPRPVVREVRREYCRPPAKPPTTAMGQVVHG